MVVKMGGTAKPGVQKAKGKKRQAKKLKSSKTAKAHSLKKGKTVLRSTSSSDQHLTEYYLLVRRFPLLPIEDDAHCSLALGVIEGLLKRELSEGAEQYLDVLVGLVETYENTAVSLPDSSEADVLRELMRANGLNQAALEKKVGIAQSTLSAVLSGVRELTKNQVITLARFFNVAPSAFLPASR